MKTLQLGILFLIALAMTGCTVYQVAPAVYTTSPPHTFDRAWLAAVGAFEDQGVYITQQDRSAAVVRGTRTGIDIWVNLRTQADGSVRVEFNTAGSTANDPGLIDRVSESYHRRMGR